MTAIECPKCAATASAEGASCAVCGWAFRPVTPVGQRLADLAGLIAALVLICAACLGIQRLLGF